MARRRSDTDGMVKERQPERPLSPREQFDALVAERRAAHEATSREASEAGRARNFARNARRDFQGEHMYLLTAARDHVEAAREHARARFLETVAGMAKQLAGPDGGRVDLSPAVGPWIAWKLDEFADDLRAALGGVEWLSPLAAGEREAQLAVFSRALADAEEQLRAADAKASFASRALTSAMNGGRA